MDERVAYEPIAEANATQAWKKALRRATWAWVMVSVCVIPWVLIVGSVGSASSGLWIPLIIGLVFTVQVNRRAEDWAKVATTEEKAKVLADAIEKSRMMGRNAGIGEAEGEAVRLLVASLVGNGRWIVIVVMFLLCAAYPILGTVMCSLIGVVQVRMSRVLCIE